MDAGKNKLGWCMKQKKGIVLADAKLHLSESYIKEADDTLENVLVTKGKWKVITGYYACYNALYSILMKCGIKSEIHDCTIGLMSLLDFDDSEIEYMKKLKQDRINVQYYLKEICLDDENKVKMFIFRCKQILNDLNSSKIEEIRDFLKL
ncbi:MAG: hypothetical protein U9P44_01485 [archaeon]|nr:hypothetical protein [archaeon]